MRLEGRYLPHEAGTRRQLANPSIKTKSRKRKQLKCLPAHPKLTNQTWIFQLWNLYKTPPPKKLKFVLFTCGWVIFFDLLGYTEKVSPDVRLWQKGRTPTETKIDCYFCVCAWFKRNKKQHVKQTPSSKGWLDTTRLTFLHLQNCTRFNFQNLNLFVTDSKVLVKKKRERI